MARPPRTEITPSVDAKGVFTAEELKELELKAQAEFEEENKTSAAAAFKEETKRKLRQKAMFAAGKDTEGEDVESIQINLAPHSPYITLDGRLYYHGLSYKFTQAQAQTIKDVMARTWQHEREIGGANMNAERGYKSLNQHV